MNNVQRVPNDPAIMQMQLSNQMGQQNFQPQFPLPVMGHVGSQLGPFGAAGNSNVGPSQYNALGGLAGLAGVGGQLAPSGQSTGAGPFGQPQSQQNKGKQASELIHGFSDNNSSSSAVEQNNQGGMNTAK